MGIVRKRFKDITYKEFKEYVEFQEHLKTWGKLERLLCYKICNKAEKAAKTKFFPWDKSKERELAFRKEIEHLHIDEWYIEWWSMRYE